MTDQEFDALVSSRQTKIANVLVSKAKEYARGDRLSNFKRAAAAMQCTPEQACVSFWMKHIVSILDMVNDLEEGKACAPQAMWEEKIGDAINYLILLEGLARERNGIPAK